MIDWISINVLIIAALVVIGLILIVVFFKKKKEDIRKEPNYQAFFSIGIIWLPVGVVFMLTINLAIGIAFMGLGASYIAIGLANRDKWEKKK